MSQMLGSLGSSARLTAAFSSFQCSTRLHSTLSPHCSQRSSTAIAAGWTWVSAAGPASTTTTASSISSTRITAGFTWSSTDVSHFPGFLCSRFYTQTSTNSVLPMALIQSWILYSVFNVKILFLLAVSCILILYSSVTSSGYSKKNILYVFVLKI